MLRSFAFLSVLVVVLSYQARNVHYMEIGEKKPPHEIDAKTQPLEIDAKTPPLGKFVYKTCSKSTAPILVRDLNIRPEPVMLGKPLVFNATVEFTETIDGEIDYTLDLMMLVGGEFRGLCDLLDPELHICAGKDICTMLKNAKLPCPSVLEKEGFNCTCPFKKNTYVLNDFVIPKLPSPKFEISGIFKVVMRLLQGKSELMCVNIQFCITNCED